MSIRDESLHLKFAMSIYLENLKQNESDPQGEFSLHSRETWQSCKSSDPQGESCKSSDPEMKEAKKVENESVQPQEHGCQTVQECLPEKDEDSSWEKLSDVGSVTSINSETIKKPEFTIDRQEIGPLPAPRSLALVTIYRYKNRTYKIPTTVMENFDYPGEVVEYIKECESDEFGDNHDNDEDDDYHDRSSLCSNKDVYQ
jgi:hypothetical protein